MNKRYYISVRNADGTIVEGIKRRLYRKTIGHLCPVFVMYQGKLRLVNSDELDFNDPVRWCDQYEGVGSMYILPRDRKHVIHQTWDDVE